MEIFSSLAKGEGIIPIGLNLISIIL